MPAPLVASFLIALLMVSLSASAWAQRPPPGGAPTSDSVRAEVLLDREPGAVVIRGAFVNEEGPSGALSYRLVVEKQGQSGTSKNRQGGRFETAPGRTDTLSTVRLGVRPEDRVEVRLAILDGDRAVAEARVARTF